MPAAPPSKKAVQPRFLFELEFAGMTMSFTEVTGLDFETEIIEYRAKKGNYSKIKMPGIHKFGNITLKRGIFKSGAKHFPDLLSIKGRNKKAAGDGILRLYDEKHKLVFSWKLKAAWPVKMEGPHLKGGGNEVAIESMELGCEGVEMIAE